MSLLAEPQHSGYRQLCQAITAEGVPVEFVEVEDWAEAQKMLEFGEVDLAAVCGLLYLLLRAKGVPLKALACPGLSTPRHLGKPVYWADVVVPEQSEVVDFSQLQGRHWVYNEKGSLSGYRAFLAELSSRGLDEAFLGRRTATGAHAKSLQMLLEGGGDFTVLDSTFLDSLAPETLQRVRVVKSLGPMPAPLLVGYGKARKVEFLAAWEEMKTIVEPFRSYTRAEPSSYREVARVWNQSCQQKEHRFDQLFLSSCDEDGQPEFTRLARREADHEILADVARELPKNLNAPPTKVHDNGVDFFLSRRGELQRHTYLIQPEKLSKGSLAVVGFLSLMKEDGDLAALFEADDRLLAEFHKYDGFLSYSPTEYAPGLWANLAVFENLRAREVWAANSIHLQAIRELGADSYRNVRLHLGTWEKLGEPISWLATRYLDYDASGLRRFVHLAE